MGDTLAPRFHFLGYALDETGVRTRWLRIEISLHLAPRRDGWGDLDLSPELGWVLSVPVLLHGRPLTDQLECNGELGAPALEIREARLDGRELTLRLRATCPLRDHRVMQSVDIDVVGPIGEVDCGGRTYLDLDVDGSAFRMLCCPSAEAVFVRAGEWE